jgi:hypothetical protein
MAYVAPTPGTFKARFPEFSAVSNDLVTLVLNEAFDHVGDTWLERDRARAQMLLAAHTLTMEGEPTRTNTGAGVGLSGAVKRRKVGDVETEFAGVGGGAGGSAGSGYSATVYGQQFLALMRKNFPAIAAV